MGRSSWPKPERLASKLLYVRSQLGLTQEQMRERLDYRKSPIYISLISDFEQGKREPPLLVLLQYARVAGVPMEALVGDDFDLPEPLEPKPGYKRAMRRAGRRKPNEATPKPIELYALNIRRSIWSDIWTGSNSTFQLTNYLTLKIVCMIFLEISHRIAENW